MEFIHEVVVFRCDFIRESREYGYVQRTARSLGAVRPVLCNSKDLTDPRHTQYTQRLVILLAAYDRLSSSLLRLKNSSVQACEPVLVILNASCDVTVSAC